MCVECSFGRTQWRKGLHLAASSSVVGNQQARAIKTREGATGNNQKFIVSAGSSVEASRQTANLGASPCRAMPTQFHMFHPVTSISKSIHVIFFETLSVCLPLMLPLCHACNPCPCFNLFVLKPTTPLSLLKPCLCSVCEEALYMTCVACLGSHIL